jgi:collagenase-like PrtC family protease
MAEFKKLEVPFNQDPHILETYKKYKNSIAEVYFPSPPNGVRGTARSINFQSIPNYLEFLKTMCNDLVKIGIKPILLLNGNDKYGGLTPKEESQLDAILSPLIESGLHSVTITDPLLVPFLKNYNIKIRASVLMNIYDPSQIPQLESLGIDEICLKTDLVRQMQTLKKIHAITTKPLSIICNSSCAYNCIYWNAHHFIMSNQTENNNQEQFNLKITMYTGEDEFGVIPPEMELAVSNFISCQKLICHLRMHRKEADFFKEPFIRPEDLYYYDNVITSFKIAGRTIETRALNEIIHAYANRTSHLDLRELLNRSCMYFPEHIKLNQPPPGFVEKVANCARNCQNCKYCESLVTIQK